VGGKTKTRTKTTNDQTVDPYTRRMIDQGFANVRGILNDNPYQAYDGNRVAGLTDTEQNVQAMYNANMGATGGLLGNALNTVKGAYQGGPQSIQTRSFADFDAAPYMNPYTDEVIDRTMSDMNRARQMAVNDMDAGLHTSAFNGSRAGVSEALTNERFIDQAGNAAAQLRQQGYDRALGLYGSDMDRAMGVDQFNVGQQNIYDQGLLARGGMEANVANTMGNRMDAETRMGMALGANERAVNQAALDAMYQEYLRGYEDPYRRAAIEGALLGQVPRLVDSSGTQTSTQSTNPGVAGVLGMGLQAAGAAGGFGDLFNFGKTGAISGTVGGKT